MKNLTNPKKDTSDLYSFLKENSLCTIAVKGFTSAYPHLSAVYLYLDNESKKLYFMTRKETHKHLALVDSAHVTTFTHTENPPVSARVDGHVRLIDQEKESTLFEKIFNASIEMVKRREIDELPLAKLLDAGALVLFEISPETIVYSDYRKDTNIVFQLNEPFV